MTLAKSIGPGEGGDDSGPKRRVHWGILGVALVPLGILVADTELSTIAAVALGGLGGALVLLALGLPQGMSRKISDVLSSYLHKVISDQQIREAGQLCSEAAHAVGGLLATVQPTGALWKRFRPRPGERRVLAVYKRRHRPSVVLAVEQAIGAGATDAGTLALAERPRDIADLNALHAGLLGMVVELNLHYA